LEVGNFVVFIKKTASQHDNVLLSKKILFMVLLHFKADRLQMIVVAEKYICVATVHQ